MHSQRFHFWIALFLAAVTVGCTSADKSIERAAPPPKAPPIALVDSAKVAQAKDSTPLTPVTEWLRWARLDSVDAASNPQFTLHQACRSYVCSQQASAGVVCGTVALHDSTSTSAPVVARLQEGDSVSISAHDIHVLSPGIVRLRRPLRVWSVAERDMIVRPEDADTMWTAAGDSLIVLANTHEGWQWLYRGKRYRAYDFWSPRDEEVSEFADASSEVSAPVVREWWQVRTRSGETGWLNFDERGGYVRLVPFDGSCGPTQVR